MILGIVPLVTVAFILMTDRTIRQVGNKKKIFKGHRNKDGEELIILIWHLNSKSKKV
jgi:hypothetical protein